MMSEGGDSMKMLGQKMFELKKYKDVLQGEAARDSSELTQFEIEMQRLRAEIDARNKAQEQRMEKLKRINLIIQETDAALQKIALNTQKLDQVIERELSSIPKQY